MRLHLVDGTYELFRAHFSKQPRHVAPQGRDVTATLGLMASMLRLLDDPAEAVTHIAVAFDRPIESFRNALFAGYKTSEGVDPVLLDQLELAEQAVAALGIVVWSMDRHEADDALATAAARFAETVEQVRLLTPDKDLGQCVMGERVVQVDRVRERILDETAVRERMGVSPDQIPDYLALVGDAADGIPGVAGFGAKTAAALLAHYPSLEAIPVDAGTWAVSVRGAPRLADSLRASRDAAALYKVLATVVRDVPLEETLYDLAWRGVPRADFEAMCAALGSERLRARPSRWRV
jgi:5'-3' exonuclease